MSLRQLDVLVPAMCPTDGMISALEDGAVSEPGVTGVTRLTESGIDFEVVDCVCARPETTALP